MANALVSTVNWPAVDYSGDETALYTNTGEGGLMVYAVWNRFIQAPSCLTDATLAFDEVFVDAHGPEAARIKQSVIAKHRAMATRSETPAMPEFSSVVLFGSTDESIFCDNYIGGSYFSVTRDDLTDTGTELLTTLERIYGAEATLVTFLDT